jgi:integrase
MNYSVVEYRKLDGDLCADLVNRNTGLPVSIWVTAHLFNFEGAPSTVLTEAYQIKFFLEYFDSEEIDQIARFESGGLLTEDEQAAFLHACRYRKDSVAMQDHKIASINQFTPKSLDSMIHANRFSQAKVAANTVRMRLTGFVRFAEFLFKQLHDRFGNRVPKDLRYRFECLCADVREVKSSIKDDNGVVRDCFQQAISTNGYFKLLECIKQHHPDNPWTDITRFRNHIILMLFIETGNRLGEICKLKISDLRDDTNPRILITRTPSDPSDPRKRAPSAKTRAHASGISRQLMKQIKLYIETERAKYVESERHDFLLVSHKGSTEGQPLSKRSIGTIINGLSSVIGEHIHPHLLRHKWNEIFSEKAEEMGYSSDKIEEIRRYACAWKEDSNTGKIYNEYHLALTAHKISTHEQSKLGLGGIGEKDSDRI